MLPALCWMHRELTVESGKLYVRRLSIDLKQCKLTLSLTVSLILAPALFATPEKNDPNDFAPAVILLVTKILDVITLIHHLSLLFESSIYYHCRPFRLDLPLVSLFLKQDVSLHHQLHCWRRKKILSRNQIFASLNYFFEHKETFLLI